MHIPETSQPDWYKSLSRFENVHIILTYTDGKKASRDHMIFFVSEEHNQALRQNETSKRKRKKSSCIYYTYFTKPRDSLVTAVFSNTVKTPSPYEAVFEGKSALNNFLAA